MLRYKKVDSDDWEEFQKLILPLYNLLSKPHLIDFDDELLLIAADLATRHNPTSNIFTVILTNLEGLL